MEENEVAEGSSFELEEEFRSGLTWRSITALLYSLFIFSPAAIYLSLVTLGAGLGSSVEYSTLLVFSEIAHLYGNPINMQEAAMIFGPATQIWASGGFVKLLSNLYFTRSPLLATFGINPHNIPWWFSPSPTSPVWDLRTFIHPDWIPPIAIEAVVHLTSLASGLFFGLLARELFIEGERLTFPMQQMIVASITSLSKREENRMIVLSWGALIGFFYGIIYYTVPAFTRVVGMRPIDPIPKPWVDFTHLIEPYLPGGAFGVTTSLTGIAGGLLIPQEVLVLGIFIGSTLRFLIINPLVIQLGWSDWATTWTPGMDLTRIYQYSQLYFWLNPIIGIGFAVGLIPLVFRGRVFIESLKGAFKLRMKDAKLDSERRIGGPPVRGEWMIFLFSFGIFGSLILDVYLIPDFPIWILLLYEFLMPLLITLSAGRMFALTGTTAGSLSIPYFNQLSIIASGYPEVKAWFLPLKVDPGTGWLGSFKVCQMTRTKIGSWAIAGVIGWLGAFFVSFLYTQIFWEMAPIPSDMYPAPAVTWPIDIMNKCIWITRPKQFFNLDSIIYWGFGFSSLMAVSWYLKSPFLMIGIASGISTPIASAITLLIGLVTKYVLLHFFGKDWVQRYKAFVIAGLALGEGSAAICGVALSMAAKAIWAGVV